jgi:hypothetical protein
MTTVLPTRGRVAFAAREPSSALLLLVSIVGILIPVHWTFEPLGMESPFWDYGLAAVWRLLFAGLLGSCLTTGRKMARAVALIGVAANLLLVVGDLVIMVNLGCLQSLECGGY